MNLLDENIPEHQRQLLRSWRIPVRQIGQDVGRKGLSDDAIISQLHQLSLPGGPQVLTPRAGRCIVVIRRA
jgi:hypothetical protein